MSILMNGFLESRDKKRRVPVYTLDNGNMSVSVCPYGGYITSIMVPDLNGTYGDVALGFDNLDDYERTAFAPCGIVGRYANRIKDGRFVSDGKEIQVTRNDGPHHLHGGKKGFHRFMWNPSVCVDNYGQEYVRLQRLSPDGEEGFSGNLSVSVHFALNKRNELFIHFLAACDKDTVCNLSNHMALNLDTCRSSTCLDHRLKIYGSTFAPAGCDGIPVGEALSTRNTNLDLRTEQLIGEQIAMPSAYTEAFGGYDHNWFLDGGPSLRPCLVLTHPKSGRTLECFTTMPCVHVYTANSLTGSETGKYGVSYKKHGAFFTETQYAPDSVNHPEWTQPFLKAGELYDHTTVYRFSSPYFTEESPV